ncbi:arylsulfatase A-like isoform X2 [Anneissia japonica]|uniref:arylsulfatase A-like isoform X2 n=1 Tax=Anneissia japonica TaxID=1529436 RepID=UPI00142584F7|nr:arylsulfatase A-like isoform X2 [Anneissia japonica]
MIIQANQSKMFLFILTICAVNTVNVCSQGKFDYWPNIVLMFADDLGYGDLPAYGHPTSYAPNLDRLANQGLLFTQFYVANPVCTPSRASLMTGRHVPRTGVYPGVFYPSSTGGLPLNETTIAEVLKTVGYNTGLVGKWHLGVGKQGMYLPTKQGFDEYYGIPYTHDMCPCVTCFYPKDPCYYSCDTQFVSCPLFKDDTLIEQPTDFVTLSERYTSQARNFISKSVHEAKPFFLYFAFHHTHNPQFASKKFRNTTIRGAFGDSLAELDWSVGEVMQQLRESGIENNTFVFFTSDNGPCLVHLLNGGSAGPLKCGKGTTYEGGQRVPAIAYWPSRIQVGRTSHLATTLDLLPTIASIVGAPLPNVTIDGVDISSIIFKGEKSNRNTFFYYATYCKPEIGVYAVRYEQFKAHYYTAGESNSGRNNHDLDCRPSAKETVHSPPLLYNLNEDLSEQYDLSKDPKYASILSKIYEIKVKFEANMIWRESEIKNKKDPSVEPCCNAGCTPFPECCSCT